MSAQAMGTAQRERTLLVRPLSISCFRTWSGAKACHLMFEKNCIIWLCANCPCSYSSRKFFNIYNPEPLWSAFHLPKQEYSHSLNFTLAPFVMVIFPSSPWDNSTPCRFTIMHNWKTTFYHFPTLLKNYTFYHLNKHNIFRLTNVGVISLRCNSYCNIWVYW